MAERARTTQSTIAAYEAGRKEPSADTMTRIARAAGLAVTWNLVPAKLLIVETVLEVSDLLAGHQDKEAFRLVADLSHRLDGLTAAELLEETGPDPGSSGDPRWDALIGGIAERAANRAGIRVPTWTEVQARFLTTKWFLSPYASVQASALVDSPPELAKRGVFLHESSLARV